MTTGKTVALTRQTFVGQVMSLLLNTLSMVCHDFPSREEVSLNFMTTAAIHSDSGAPKIKSVTASNFSLFAMKSWDWMPWSSFFECWVLSHLFHSPLSPSSRSSLVPLNFLPLGWYHLRIWGYWYFSWQSWFQLVIHPAWHFTWCALHIS